MPSNKKRLIHMNRYQWRVLVMVLIPPVAIVLCLTLLVKVFFDQLMGAVQAGSTDALLGFLGSWQWVFFFALWGLLALIVITSYVVTQNLLGAFTRLFREMDEMIAGERSKGPFKARKRDDLANELLTRVNRLCGRGDEH